MTVLSLFYLMSFYCYIMNAPNGTLSFPGWGHPTFMPGGKVYQFFLITIVLVEVELQVNCCCVLGHVGYFCIMMRGAYYVVL